MCCSVSGLNALLDAEVGGLSLCTWALKVALRVTTLDSGQKEEHGPPATPGRWSSSLKLKAARMIRMVLLLRWKEEPRKSVPVSLDSSSFSSSLLLLLQLVATTNKG